MSIAVGGSRNDSIVNSSAIRMAGSCWPAAAAKRAIRAPVRPGDAITGAVEITEVRSDKPITKLFTTVTRDDGTLVLEGTALCYTMALP